MTLLLRSSFFLSCFLDDAMFILIMFMSLVYLTVDDNPLSLVCVLANSQLSDDLERHVFVPNPDQK